jgi:hypothetical protein
VNDPMHIMTIGTAGVLSFSQDIGGAACATVLSAVCQTFGIGTSDGQSLNGSPGTFATAAAASPGATFPTPALSEWNIIALSVLLAGICALSLRRFRQRR